ncbi:MAG: two pore domain potassium channel family protein [Candidatus Eremiobacteraeota bacterium]|nr:two pore domain potassium channel family protein [Candidatus Eremiobacteraeota bacterium]
MIVDILSIGLGGLLILWALNDVFQSVIVPRAVGDPLRASFQLRRFLWRLWPAIALRFYGDNEDRREDFLAIFAPATLIFFLLVWTATLIFGYGLIFYGLRGGLTPDVHGLGAATYFAGTSFTTIGFGDIAGRDWATRFFSICAGVSGLALFSITTAYLFALFGAFQNREAFVVLIGARAGHPASGVNLLAVAGYAGVTDHFNALMYDAQRWTAIVMESHLAYGILGYFRSSHDYESWVGTLGTLLDAATLLMTTVDGVPCGQARIFYNIGRHATRDLSKYYHTHSVIEGPEVERAEFDHACDRLANAGYTLHARDQAWERFSSLRSSYAPHLNAMARHFLIPPLQWIGDRSTIHGLSR